jgi:hypothetical protein
MDVETFRAFLVKSGKKPHVVEKLIGDVVRFEAFLEEGSGRRVDNATSEDLRAYAAALEEAKKGSAKIGIRGVALYYQAAGNEAMAAVASSIRERGTAKDRKAFVLGEFRGVDPDHVAKLKAHGVRDVSQMLEAGSTPQARTKLARRTGVPLDAILEFVKLSDLARIPGVKSIRARLYYDSGLDTLDKLAQLEPDALREMMIEFVERTGFDGIATLPKEAEFTITKARHLPRIVQY